MLGREFTFHLATLLFVLFGFKINHIERGSQVTLMQLEQFLDFTST